MDIDIRDTITLGDDKDYLVVSKINLNNEIYYLLLTRNSEGNREIKYCREDQGNNLKIIKDKTKQDELFPLLMAESIKHLTKEEFSMMEKMIAEVF